MNYKYKIGNHCVQIKDELGLLDLDFDFFEPADSVNRGDVICVMNPFDGCACIPKGLLEMHGKLIEGHLRGKFYSILVNRKIVIESDKKEKHINVYVDKGSINIMSVYSFFVCLKKHVVYIFSNKGNAILHGALVYDPRRMGAYMILGGSGGGKSTISWMLLQYGLELLSDDMVFMDVDRGEICGGGGYLYVTKDFVERFNIKEYTIVNPGRKNRITVNDCEKSNAQILSVILASGVSDENGLIVSDSETVYEEMMNTQKGWIGSDCNMETVKSIMRRLAFNVNVYKVFLNSGTAHDLRNIIHV